MNTIFPLENAELPGYIGLGPGGPPYGPGYPGPRDGMGGWPGGPDEGTDALGGPLGLDVGGPPGYMPPPEPGGGIGPLGDPPPA